MTASSVQRGSCDLAACLLFSSAVRGRLGRSHTKENDKWQSHVGIHSASSKR